MTDTAELWDVLAASRPLGASTRAAATCKLALRPEPRIRHLAEKERAIAEIAEPLRQAFRRCVLGEGRWPLFVHGPAGVGKTCAALALLDVVAGPTCYYTAAAWSARLVEAANGRASERSGADRVRVTPQMLRERIAAAALVVLDEVGTRSNVSDWAYECVKEVIDVRYGKPLVCISNHDLDGIQRLYDDRVADRLSGGTVVQVLGESRRTPGGS